MGEKMTPQRSMPLRSPAICLMTVLASTAAVGSAWAAPIKVACIGEHTTHGHAYPATNREQQPVGMQEYPAQLQTMLGAGYDVRNFGDCCSSVMGGYTVAETHPYVNGSNNGDGPGYKESIAFLPDIVVIGSWGRHDWGLNKAPGQVFTLPAFQAGFDDLIQKYQALSSHPKIFISYPIPILNGQGDVPDQGVTTSSVKPAIDAIAKKYSLPIIDLYTPFLNHKELFKQPPDGEGEGEHPTPAGLTIIAQTVFAAMKADLAQDGGTDGSSGSGGSGGAAGASDAASGTGGAGGLGSAGDIGSGGDTNNGGSASQGSAGSEQAGSSAMSETGGSSAASSPSAAPASSDSGCSCALAAEQPAAGRLLVLALGGLAFLARRKKARG
jgi:sialate O-acetylesterase